MDASHFQLLTEIAAGHARPWVAALVWLVISGATVALGHAIRRQHQRERRQHTHRWRDHEHRITRIEHYLFDTEE